MQGGEDKQTSGNKSNYRAFFFVLDSMEPKRRVVIFWSPRHLLEHSLTPIIINSGNWAG